MRIGLTYTGTEEKHQNYINWLKGYTVNSTLEIITLSATQNNAYELEHLDGLVLSGGVDTHPAFYKGQSGYPNAPEEYDQARDVFEIALFNKSQLLQLPVLGVCRGMQLINCTLGGDLVQDIGDERNKIHRFDKNDKAHGLQVESNSLLYTITGAERTVVNSAHHQALNRLGEGLQINCLSDDGIIEGVEWIDKTNKPFLLCIQWHPERMYKFQLAGTAVSKNIRDRFIEAVHSSKNIYHENN